MFLVDEAQLGRGFSICHRPSPLRANAQRCEVLLKFRGC